MRAWSENAGDNIVIHSQVFHAIKVSIVLQHVVLVKRRAYFVKAG